MIKMLSALYFNNLHRVVRQNALFQFPGLEVFQPLRGSSPVFSHSFSSLVSEIVQPLVEERDLSQFLQILCSLLSAVLAMTPFSSDMPGQLLARTRGPCRIS